MLADVLRLQCSLEITNQIFERKKSEETTLLNSIITTAAKLSLAREWIDSTLYGVHIKT